MLKIPTLSQGHALCFMFGSESATDALVEGKLTCDGIEASGTIEFAIAVSALYSSDILSMKITETNRFPTSLPDALNKLVDIEWDGSGSSACFANACAYSRCTLRRVRVDNCGFPVSMQVTLPAWTLPNFWILGATNVPPSC
eukprot:GHVU01175587.1.p1 GENE.GHVU01175587.1~~GHVU01175587.1.p1  ORF type:complete len:142 (+),score=3.34 GHVU01175587.1:506-931(+)